LRKVWIGILSGQSIGLGDFLAGGIQVDGGCPETPMSHLFLHDRQGDTSIYSIVHDVAMPKGMDGEHPQVPAESVLSIDLLQARLLNIDLKNLPNPVFSVGVIPPSSGVKYVGLRFQEPFVPLTEDSLLAKKTLDLVGQSLGQMAGPGMTGLGVFSREKDRAATQVQVLALDADELADTAAELIDRLEHEFVPVVVDAVEELGQFVDGEISNDLAKSLILPRCLDHVVTMDSRQKGFLEFHLIWLTPPEYIRVSHRSAERKGNERFINFKYVMETTDRRSCLFRTTKSFHHGHPHYRPVQGFQPNLKNHPFLRSSKSSRSGLENRYFTEIPPKPGFSAIASALSAYPPRYLSMS
jgi:hypothetical protein